MNGDFKATQHDQLVQYPTAIVIVITLPNLLMYKLRSQSMVVPPYQEVFRHSWPTTVVLSLNKHLVVLRHIIEPVGGGGGGATKRSSVLVYIMDSIEGLG